MRVRGNKALYGVFCETVLLLLLLNVPISYVTSDVIRDVIIFDTPSRYGEVSASSIRDTIVAGAQARVGDHYVFAGGHYSIGDYPNDFHGDSGYTWDSEDPNVSCPDKWNNEGLYWKFETTRAVWLAWNSENGTKGQCPYVYDECGRYWDNCQGHGGGTRTSCKDRLHFDCVGLVVWVYQSAGCIFSPEPWTVGSLQGIDKNIETVSDLRAGDLCYQGSSHVGIYSGTGTVFHANGHLRGVVEDAFSTVWDNFGSLFAVKLECPDNEHTVEPGYSTQYEVTVTNEGGVRDTISLNWELVDSKGTWDASLSKSSVTLPGKPASEDSRSEKLYLTVTSSDPEAQEGDYAKIAVTCTSSGDSMSTVTTATITTITSVVEPPIDILMPIALAIVVLVFALRRKGSSSWLKSPP